MLGHFHLVGLGEPAGNDGPLAGMHGFDPGVGFPSVDPRRHDHVQDKEIRAVPLHIFDRLLAAGGRRDHIAQGLQHLADDFPLHRLVVHYQYPLALAQQALLENDLGGGNHFCANSRELDGKGRPLRIAVKLQGGLVVVDDIPHHGQPQAGATPPHDLAGVEWFENPLQVGLVDAGSIVGHREDYLFAL